MVAGSSSLLDLDPEIGKQIDPDSRGFAHRALQVELVKLPTGPLRVAASSRAGARNLLIVNGLLKREVRLATGRSIEPLGPGDGMAPDVP